MKAHRCFLAALVLLALPSAGAEPRTVAIGDVHGNYEGLVEILEAAELIGEDGSWSGSTTTLVQLGDFLDRGPRTREIMDLFRRLQGEAAEDGGRVEILLGNHEAMNLLSVMRDVGPASYEAWVTPDSPRAQKEEFKAFLKAARKRSQLMGSPRPSSTRRLQEEWMDLHPPGQLEYLESLSPESEYGQWLRTLPIVAVVDDVLFLHGGLHPEVAGNPPAVISARAHDEISRADECRVALEEAGYLTRSSSGTDLIQTGVALVRSLREKQERRATLGEQEASLLETIERCEDYEDWYLLHPDGPLWFRGYAEPRGSRFGWSDEEGLAKIQAVLEAQGVRAAVVAHTPQARGLITTRFGGRIFLIDTGMLSSVYVGGQASALEIEGGVFTAIYTTDRQVLHTAQQPRSGFDWEGPDGEIVSFDSEDAFLDYLRTAKIVRRTRISTGINSIDRFDLEQDGKRLRAAFREYEHTWSRETAPDGKWHQLYKDSWAYEPAAYELSRLLELDRVPPTTLRRSHGNLGSVQAWVETGWLEADMKVRKIRPPDVGRRVRQLVQRRMFDALINNQDRNDGNSKTDEDWKMWFIDHGRSFLIEPADERIGDLTQADRRLLDKMRNANRDAVKERLDPHLSSAELEFLFRRWDKILQHFDRLIEERGPEFVYYGD